MLQDPNLSSQPVVEITSEVDEVSNMFLYIFNQNAREKKLWGRQQQKQQLLIIYYLH